MIKKNTKVIFKDGPNDRSEELVGGIPLSQGEVIHVHENGEVVDFEVVDKIIDCYLGGEDQIVDITYVVSKRS